MRIRLQVIYWCNCRPRLNKEYRWESWWTVSVRQNQITMMKTFDVIIIIGNARSHRSTMTFTQTLRWNVFSIASIFETISWHMFAISIVRNQGICLNKKENFFLHGSFLFNLYIEILSKWNAQVVVHTFHTGTSVGAICLYIIIGTRLLADKLAPFFWI